jgi:type IV secretory pathway TrbL component
MPEVHDEVVTEFWLTTLAAVEFVVGLCGHTAALTGIRMLLVVVSFGYLATPYSRQGK